MARAPTARRHRISKGTSTLAALLLAGSLSLGPATPVALAERTHTVAQGQTLARIAQRYGISISALAGANGLGRDPHIRPGQILVVPPRGVVYVRSGDTLAAIAKRHGASVDALARQNRLKPDAMLRIDQRLILPGYEAAAKQAAAARRWGAPKRPGVASLYRVWSEEKEQLRLVDSRGRVRRHAIDRLQHLLRPKNTRKRKQPHRRLVQLMARVSDHFGGRRLDIISGYRLAGGYTKDSSRHVAGQAVDFRIPGVPLQVLRDYCAQFDHVGVGFYPRSRFVHLDVRRKNARWTDWSSPGQAPLRRNPQAADGAGASTAHEHELADEPSAEDDGQPPVDDAADEISDE